MAKILRPALVSLLLAAGLISITRPGAYASQGATPGIRIIYPPNGTVVSSHGDLEIVAELAPQFQDPDNFRSIQFVVASPDGTRVFNLGSGDLRSFKAPHQARRIWRTRAIPGGPYIVLALLDDQIGNRFVDRVRIVLNRAPAAQIVTLATEVVSDGVRVTFRPDVRDVEGDRIARVLWTPGDGSASVERSDLSPFTHTYAGVPGRTTTYVVTLTAEDARGGQVAVERDVMVDETNDTTDVEVRQTHDCGCRQMAIFARAVIGTTRSTYCMPGALTEEQLKALVPGAILVRNPRGEEACPPGRTPFKSLLGPLAPGDALGWQFEVSAELDPMTNDISRCTQGQVARGDRSIDGRPLVNPSPAAKPPAGANLPFGPPRPPGALVGSGPGNRYPPAAGPNWGADDYAAPNEEGPKLHLSAAKRIRWFDVPHIRQSRPDGTVATTMAEHLRFVAWVNGTGGGFGTCWCEFEYQHSWDANDVGKPGTPDGRTGPNGLTLVSGQNCSLR